MERPHILIVEDDNLISTYLEDKLNESFQVSSVRTAAEARSVLERGRVALIVLDILLPDENGFTFLESLKEAGSPHRDIPVLILSNLGQPADIARGQRLGAVEYLVKANQLPGDVVESIKQILTTTAT